MYLQSNDGGYIVQPTALYYTVLKFFKPNYLKVIQQNEIEKKNIKNNFI